MSRNQKRRSFFKAWKSGELTRLGRKLHFESLEERALLTIAPTFFGPISLSVGTLVNITKAPGNQAEGTIAVDPTSPNRVFEASNPGDSAARSTNGGASFANFNLGVTAAPCCDNDAVWDSFGNLFVTDIDMGADGNVGGGDDSIVLLTSTTGAPGSFTLVATIDTGSEDQPSVAAGAGSVWVTWNDGSLKARGAPVTGLGVIGAFNAEQTVPGGGQFGDIAINPLSGAVVVTYQTIVTCADGNADGDSTDPGECEGPGTIFTNTDADGLGPGGFGAQVNVTGTNVGLFDYIPAQPGRSVDAEANLAYGPNGTLYMSYTDEPVDESNDMDIFFRRSFNNGATWSAALEITDEVGNNSQFLPQIAVDSTTGFVGVGWHDARFDNGQNDAIDDNNSIANDEANYFVSISTDGGATFLPNVVVTPSASNAGTAGSNVDYGDYTGLDFFGGILRPVWADNSNSTGDNPAGKGGSFDMYTTGVRVQATSEIITVNGDEDFAGENDKFIIKLDSSGTFIQFFENGVLKFTAPKASVTQIIVLGKGGDDTLCVDSSNGLISIPNGIQYNGGTGFNNLVLLQTGGDTQTSDTYSVGPNPGEGSDIIVGPSGTQKVEFESLAPVLNTVPAALLTVNATPADNAINYSQGSVVANGLITIDNFESIEFSAKTNLVINGLAGSDEINLNDPSTPTGLTSITVNGGDPTASDNLIVNGTSGADSINVELTAIGAATITGAGPVPISATTVEHLDVNAQGSVGLDDIIEVTTPGSAEIVAQPDDDDLGSGSIRVNDLVPIRYSGFDPALGTLIFSTAGGARSDILKILGTSGNDDVDGTGASGSLFFHQITSSGFFTTLVVETPGVSQLEWLGLDGDDSFSISGDHPYSRVVVEGGNGDDKLFFSRSTNIAGDVTVDLGSRRLSETSFGAVEYSSDEVVNIFANGNNVTVLGTGADDVLDVTPTGAGTGHFTANGPTPVFNYSGVGTAALTFTGGSVGFDTLNLFGDDGANIVTSTATTVTIDGGAVTIGASIDKLTLNTLDGNDNIDLDLNVAGLQKSVDAGDGNDTVDMSGTIDADMFGGLGDDTLIGTPAADNIYGGAGNDVLIGLGGNDTAYGEDGNDHFGDPAIRDPAANDAGNDQFFGGAGSDVFFWDPGDGDDVIEGGAGDSDQIFFFGNAGAEQFFLFADTNRPSRFHLFRVQAAIDIDAADIEEVNLNPLGGTDTVTVGRSDTGVLSDLTTTTVRAVDVSLGSDGVADNLFFEGRPLADNLLASVSLGIVKVAGLSYDLRFDGSDAGTDRLTIRGNEGHDTIKAEAGVEATVLITLDGGTGNDNLSADAILIGGPGNDFMEGGAGDDQFFGNAGEDTMIGGGGTDTFDGGSEFDTILVRGTSANDVISANQTADTALVTTLNGIVDTDILVTLAGVRTVERVRIEAGDGDDIVFVTHADALGVDAFVNSVLFDIEGGEAHTRDRLSIQDNGIGDLLLYRKGESDSAGSISVGPGNAESLENVFANVEFIQPLAG
ncbi:MAG TPA: hypothetical protein VFB96_13710, partial [Pirellulaceae bacterium]|nr:hypothetical protein [Pirellulaceae bacterium]